MESQLRPREIQARIRSGETPEAVAHAAGVTVDQIDAFAAPVMAERSHVVGMALGGHVRRTGEMASTRVLRQTIAEELLRNGHDIDDVEWDSWRRSDGRWVVQGSYGPGLSKHVQFLFDVKGRFSVAANAEAQHLVDDRTPEVGRRRRQVDPDNEPTVELDDNLALVRATMPHSSPSTYSDAPGYGGAEHEPNVVRRRSTTEPEVPDYQPAELAEVDGVYDLVPPRSEMDVLYDMISGIDEDSVRIYTGLQQPVTPREEPEQLSLIDLVDDEEPSAPAPATDETDPDVAVFTIEEIVVVETNVTTREETPRAADPAPAPADDVPVAEAQPKPTTNPVTGTARPAPSRRRSRSKRASVPSWDEIMFGGPTES